MSTQNASIKDRVPDDKVSLKYIFLKVQGWWTYLLGKWMLILLVGLTGGALGFVYASLQKPLYLAKQTFVLEDPESKRMSNLGGLASMAGITVSPEGGGIFQGNNIIELYNSRTMLSETLLSTSAGNDSLLIDRYIAFNELKENWKEKPNLKDLRFDIQRSKFSLQHDSVMGEIVKTIRENNLKVSKPDKQLSLIAVETSIENEQFAKDFTIALVEKVNDFYVETKIGKSAENVAIIQYQTDSVRRALNAAIGGMAAAMDANPNPNTALRMLSVPSSKKRFDVQANETILMELVRNLETSKIALRRETPLIQVVDKPILPLEKQRFGKLTALAIGGFLAGLFICFFLILAKEVKEILEADL